MVKELLDPGVEIEAHAIWTETGFQAVHLERRGPKLFFVFKLKDGENLSIQARDMVTWVKAMPLIYEATGYPLGKMEPESWRTLARAMHSYAGVPIVVSRETEEMNDIMLAWLEFPGTKNKVMANMESETMTSFAKDLHVGKLDVIHDDVYMVYRLDSIITFCKRRSQGLTRDDIVGVLYSMGHKRRKHSGFRFWTGDKPS